MCKDKIHVTLMFLLSCRSDQKKGKIPKIFAPTVEYKVPACQQCLPKSVKGWLGNDVFLMDSSLIGSFRSSWQL